MAQDLKVITKAKELAELVYEITERSPKKFRFTIVGLMQNLSLGIVDELYKANDVYVETQYTRELKNDVEELKHNCGTGRTCGGGIGRGMTLAETLRLTAA